MAATARATVTIEIPINDSWGEDCTVGQIYKQAEDSARGKIAKMTGAVIKDIKIDAVIYPNRQDV